VVGLGGGGWCIGGDGGGDGGGDARVVVVACDAVEVYGFVTLGDLGGVSGVGGG